MESKEGPISAAMSGNRSMVPKRFTPLKNRLASRRLHVAGHSCASSSTCQAKTTHLRSTGVGISFYRRERGRERGREGERREGGKEGGREGGRERGWKEGGDEGGEEYSTQNSGMTFNRDPRGPSQKHGDGLLDSPTAIKWLSKVNHLKVLLVLTACPVSAGRTQALCFGNQHSSGCSGQGKGTADIWTVRRSWQMGGESTE